MIAARPPGRHTTATPGWQQELAEAIEDPLELLAVLGLKPGQLDPPQTAESLRAAARLFRLRVPRGFVRRMRAGDPRDPLLRQVLPLAAELGDTPGFTADPLAEAAARRAPALLHKYAGRALLVTTGACAVHCRYCFRRHFDYGADQSGEGQGRWNEALDTVRGDATITELILSGGDPLSLGNPRLAALLEAVRQIPHVSRIRMHTRTPIVLPSRIDAALLDLLGDVRRDLVIVVHANHAAEIDAPVAAALAGLRGASKLLLNQAVLLAGVNDDAGTLTALSLRLFECGVLPYYLHQLDRVAGTAHFEVSDERALHLVAAVNARLPGYLVPKLVREVAGAPGKLPLVGMAVADCA
jgi:EF-P beta-lysylation protein EpmB